jgi:hypothetical protein
MKNFNFNKFLKSDDDEFSQKRRRKRRKKSFFIPKIKIGSIKKSFFFFEFFISHLHSHSPSMSDNCCFHIPCSAIEVAMDFEHTLTIDIAKGFRKK